MKTRTHLAQRQSLKEAYSASIIRPDQTTDFLFVVAIYPLRHLFNHRHSR